jgi:hypothetical protein
MNYLNAKYEPFQRVIRPPEIIEFSDPNKSYVPVNTTNFGN